MIWKLLLTTVLSLGGMLHCQIIMYKYQFELKYSVTPQESLEINPLLQFFSEVTSNCELSRFELDEDCRKPEAVTFTNSSLGYPVIRISAANMLEESYQYTVYFQVKEPGGFNFLISKTKLFIMLYVQNFYQPNFRMTRRRTVYPEQVDVLSLETATLETNLPNKDYDSVLPKVGTTYPDGFQISVSDLQSPWEKLVLRKPDYSTLKSLMVFGDYIIAEFALDDSFTEDELRIIKMYSLLRQEIKLEVDSNEVAYQEEMEGNLHNLRPIDKLTLVPSSKEPYVLHFVTTEEDNHTEVGIRRLANFAEESREIHLSFAFPKCTLHEFQVDYFALCWNGQMNKIYVYRYWVWPFTFLPIVSDTLPEPRLGNEVPAITPELIVRSLQSQLTKHKMEVDQDFFDPSLWSIKAVDVTINSTENPVRQLRVRGLARFNKTGHHAVFGFFLNKAMKKHTSMKILSIWEPQESPSMFMACYDQVYFYVDGQGLYSSKTYGADKFIHFDDRETNLEYVKHQKFELLDLLFLVKRDRITGNLTCAIHKLGQLQKVEHRVYYLCPSVKASDIDADWSESLPETLRIIYYSLNDDPKKESLSRGAYLFSSRVNLKHPTIAATYSPRVSRSKLIPPDQLSRVFTNPFEIELKISKGYSPIVRFSPPDKACDLQITWRNHSKSEGYQKSNTTDLKDFVMYLHPGDKKRISDLFEFKGPLMGVHLEKNSNDAIMLAQSLRQIEQSALDVLEKPCADWRILEIPEYHVCIDQDRLMSFYYKGKLFDSVMLADLTSIESTRTNFVDMHEVMLHIYKDHFILLMWGKQESTYKAYSAASLQLVSAPLPNPQAILSGYSEPLKFKNNVLVYAPIGLRGFSDDKFWKVKSSIHYPSRSLMMLVRFKRSFMIYLYPLEVILSSFEPDIPNPRNILEEDEFAFSLTVDEDEEKSNILFGLCEWLNDTVLIATAIGESHNVYISVLTVNPLWDLHKPFPRVSRFRELGAADYKSYLFANLHGAFYLDAMQSFPDEKSADSTCGKNYEGLTATSSVPLLILYSLTNFTTFDMCFYAKPNPSDPTLPVVDVQLFDDYKTRYQYYLPVVDEYVDVIPLRNYFLVIKSPSRTFGTNPSSTTNTVQSVGYLFELRKPHLIGTVSFPYSSSRHIFGPGWSPDTFWMLDSETGEFSVFKAAPVELMVPRNITCVPGDCNTLVRLVFKGLSPLTTSVNYEFKLMLKLEEPTLVTSLKNLLFWRSQIWKNYWLYIGIVGGVLLLIGCWYFGRASLRAKRKDASRLKNIDFYPNLSRITSTPEAEVKSSSNKYMSPSVLTT